MQTRAIPLALSLLLLVTGCNLGGEGNPLTGGDLSVEKEREVTADVASQIRNQLELISDPVLLAYVNELGQKIVAVTEPQPFIYRFALIEDDTLNAFTIGGGYVYLNSGVMASSGDVAELVGVISHEVAHVRRRHIAKRGENQGLSTLITMATLAAVAFGGGDPGLLAVGQGVNVALQLQNTREAEAEADREAIAYMVRAGYDPAGMTRFFQRLVATYPTSGPDIPDYLYSHPAVKERVSASKVEMKRVDAPRDLIRYDPRLPLMQGRLARLLEPTVGGSGLHARPDFDRSVTDPLLEEAGFALEAGRTDEADLLLERAEQLEPADPRVALRRADIAEDRGDWATSADHLKRAFEIDPAGPLVLYRLGIAHRQQGSRTQAVFYLEQAAAAYRPGSAGRRRADLEIDRLTFPLLDDSGLHAEGSAEDRRSFGRGETIVWSGELADRYLPRNPKIEIEWLDPDGAVAHRELVRMNAFGNVTSRLDASLTRVGIWTVRVSTEDSPVDTYTFAIEESHGSPD